ncbi:hypothetical protein JXO59_05255 [candidate division KSB1 bacterium]|nr:hypothetical protein [candidate division KSB1 bacterium]
MPRLSAPKKLTWLISVILAVVSIVAWFVPLGIVTTYAFWLLFIGFLLLFLGTTVKGF